MPFSGMWHCVDLLLTDVSVEYIASIVKVEISSSEEPARAGGCRLQSATSQKTAFFRSNLNKWFKNRDIFIHLLALITPFSPW
jgi:hypothetical protein